LKPHPTSRQRHGLRRASAAFPVGNPFVGPAHASHDIFAVIGINDQEPNLPLVISSLFSFPKRSLYCENDLRRICLKVSCFCFIVLPMKQSSFLLFLLVPLSCLAQDVTRTVNLPGMTALKITMPTNWDLEQKRNLQTDLTWKVSPPTNQEVYLQISFLIDTEEKFKVQGSVNDLVQGVAKGYLPSAAEKQVKLQDLKSTNGVGSFVQFTDAALVGKPLPPDQYRTVTFGAIEVGNTFISFTVLANSFSQDSYKDVLKFLRSGIVTDKH
jgi:hypothetical protein